MSVTLIPVELPLAGTVEVIVDRKTLRRMVSYSIPSIVRLERAGLFPAAIRISSTRSVWSLNDVISWMEAKANARPRTATTVLSRSDRFLSPQEVRSLVLYSRAHIYRLELRGEFPERISLSAMRVAWLEREIAEWITAKRAKGRQDEFRSLDSQKT